MDVMVRKWVVVMIDQTEALLLVDQRVSWDRSRRCGEGCTRMSCRVGGVLAYLQCDENVHVIESTTGSCRVFQLDTIDSTN